MIPRSSTAGFPGGRPRSSPKYRLAPSGDRRRAKPKAGGAGARRVKAETTAWQHFVKRPEDARYNFGPDGHNLTIYRAGIDAPTLDTFRGSPVALALSVAHPLFILMYRFFPKGLRGNAPFAWKLTPPESRVLPEEVSPEVRSRLTLTLVSSEDFAVRAVRGIPLPADLANGLRNAIHDQAAGPFDPIAYARALAMVHLDCRDLWAQQERIVASMATLE